MDLGAEVAENAEIEVVYQLDGLEDEAEAVRREASELNALSGEGREGLASRCWQAQSRWASRVPTLPR